MLKFFKNIRHGLITKNRIGKYLIYAIGEIILVVIGILIAVQINSWNNKRLDKKSEIKSYLNIKRQIADDRKELLKVKGINIYFSTSYEHANNIILTKNRNEIDTLVRIAMGLSQYSDFHRSGHIYETLVNSGDLSLLKNSEIPSKLQTLEMTYIFANKLEDIHWEIIINELSPELRGVINYATLEPVKPEKLYGVELQNILIESIFLTKAKDSVYTKALKEIDVIIGLIDEEVNPENE